MTEPTWAAELFGIKFLIDTADFTIVTFDGIDVDIAANAEQSLEVNGVDYQVPSGKILRLLGCELCVSEGNNVVVTQTDGADNQVGTVDKFTAPFTSTLIGNGKGPITIFDVTFAALKYVTLHNKSSSLKVITLLGFTGLEYTVV